MSWEFPKKGLAYGLFDYYAFIMCVKYQYNWYKIGIHRMNPWYFFFFSFIYIFWWNNKYCLFLKILTQIKEITYFVSRVLVNSLLNPVFGRGWQNTNFLWVILEKSEKLGCYCMCFFGKSWKSVCLSPAFFFFWCWCFGREIPGCMFFPQSSLWPVPV